MKQIHFFFNQQRCTGCAACAVACKDWNQLPAGHAPQWRRVYTAELGRFPAVEVLHLCMSCFHCDNAPCVKACPTGALYKRTTDGIVLVDRERCEGCRACERACPYGAPQYQPGDLRMMKCTFCVDRQALGLAPACVEACPYLALDAGTREQLEVRHGKLSALSAEDFPDLDAEHEATRPSVFVQRRAPRHGTDVGVSSLRRNGEATSHLRTVAGPTRHEWQQQAAQPLPKQRRHGKC